MVNVHLVHLISLAEAEEDLTKQETRAEAAVSVAEAEAVIDKIHLQQVQLELQIQAVAEEHVVFLQIVTGKQDEQDEH